MNRAVSGSAIKSRQGRFREKFPRGIDQMISAIRADMELDFGGATVDEVHIDFLLEEEFTVNLEFLRRFVTGATDSIDQTDLSDFLEGSRRPDAQFSVISVRHSVSDAHGEADLIVIYQLGGTKKRVAILIEDKIRAPFQPLQAKRYKDRGLLGKANNEWDEYFTCLVASTSYIKGGHGFDAAVELEQIKDWMGHADPKRSAFKAEVIDRAIKKASITGVKVIDEAMTAFRHRHYEFFEEFFKEQLQELKLRQPGPTWRGDCWFEIRGCSKQLLGAAYINHKADRGFVDLTFPNTDASRLQEIKAILESGMLIEQTYKSAAIRLAVPAIKDFGQFDRERATIAEAFSAATRLIAFYMRERDRLAPILAAARTAPPM
jgi:hypothetical protein